MNSKEAHDLGIFLAQTVISWGVPGAVLGTVGILVASAGRKGDEPPPLPPALAKALGVSDEPKEYLKIEKMNEKLLSYEYSFTKASVSPQTAKRTQRRAEIERQLGSEFRAFGLDTATVDKVYQEAKAYRKAEEKVTKKLETLLVTLRASGLSPASSPGGSFTDSGANGEAAAKQDEEAENEGALSMLTKKMPGGLGGGGPGANALRKQVGELQKEQLELEMNFLSKLSSILSKDQAAALAAVLKPPQEAGAMGGPRGASSLSEKQRTGGRLDALAALVTAAAEASGRQKHVYVLKFFGDVTASQVSQLRQEVTAVLRNADVDGRGDEVVLVLNTGGGTVTGYGLAAAQLERLKQAGIKLTICVEQVAASGGYMMACVADELVASPFAVLGSIGVITEQPNVYERLKQEGVSFNTVTAGKYKRTLTPTKKVDSKDLEKLKEDIAQILMLFKGFVAKNRPQLDIEKVATGETWFGPDALERQMVDTLKTVDDVLLGFVDAGAQVFGVTYQEKPKSPLAALSGAGGQAAVPSLQTLALSWLARSLEGNAAARGSTAEQLQLLLQGQRAENAMLRRPMGEPELMASQPLDVAEPMVQWGAGNYDGAESGTSDSWHL